MTTSYFVVYRGASADPAGFVDRYREVHVPILAEWPGMWSISLHTPVGWTDTQPITRSHIALMCQMEFESQEKLDAALASEARLRARDDFRKFPRFDGEVLHQAMHSERLFQR